MLVSTNFICEVRVSTDETEFDVVAKNTVKNYRVRLWSQEIKEQDVVKASYELAAVTLVHDFVALSTEISYAGNARQDWLNCVLEALPIGLLRDCHGGAG
jgi:hypothetical protein